MRRVIVTAVFAAASVAGLAGHAAATDPISKPSFYDCYGVDADGAEAGVCAGIVCWDLCGPTLIVDPYCRQAGEPHLAACAAVDEVHYSSR